MVRTPSCFRPAIYDPQTPLRDPRSRRSMDDCTADMAACMQEICSAHGQGTVTEDDLMRAGFVPNEIETCRGAAVAALTERLRPCHVDRGVSAPRAA